MKKLAGIVFLLLFAHTCISQDGIHNIHSQATSIKPSIHDGVELLWSISIGSNRLAGGVAADPSKRVVYALPPVVKGPDSKTCVEVTADGKVVREFTFHPTGKMLLRTAHLQKSSQSDLLFFSHWVGDLAAADSEGKSLWVYKGIGINDVWVADLDGDRLDEIIIGYSGFTGLHVLNRHGNLLWKNQQIGNVGCVCAADLDGDGKAEVIGTSTTGKIHVFTSEGKRLPDIQPPAGYYAHGVRTIKLSESARSEGLLVTGHKSRIAALKGNGSVVWETKLSIGGAHILAEPAPGKPWLASPDSAVVVLDTRTGSVIARVNYPDACKLCWLETKGQDSPLLIISTPQNITAYRVIGGTNSVNTGKSPEAIER